MALQIRYSMSVCFVPDGAGPMSVPSAQVKTVTQSTVIVVGGANSPTAAQIVTACAAAGTDASNQFNTAANLAQIDAFGSGGN